MHIAIAQSAKCLKEVKVLTRGFITVATGNEDYYRQAYNLLRSFRLFHPDVPFAVLCDKKNKYTDAFTDTVILSDPQKNYLDKFSILTESPYDESIFIESDCLVYHSLDHMWELLGKEYDFTSFGWNDSEPLFFANADYAAEKFLGSPDARMPTFTPGFMFIRKGDVCKQIYQDAMQMIDEIHCDPLLAEDIHLHCNKAIRDDPIFFLAMARNGCRCTFDPFVGKCVFLPGTKKIYHISLSKGKLDVFWHRELTDCNLLHFSSRRAREEGLYLQQVLVLDLLCRKRGKAVVRLMESKPVFLLLDLYKKIQTRRSRQQKRKSRLKGAGTEKGLGNDE